MACGGLVWWFGAVALLYVAYRIFDFFHLHFLRTTDFKKYGAGSGSWAVVTGSREGIGAGLAKALAKEGFNIVLMARDEKGLKDTQNEIETTFKVKTKAFSCDANDTKAVSTIVQGVAGLDVSILVNNVGVNTDLPTLTSELNEKEVDNMINVNVTFTTKLTQAFIPILAKRSNSLLVTLSSFTGFFPVPMLSVYAASKAYDAVFAQAVAGEVAGSGIDSTVIAPQYVVSKMAGFKKASLFVPDAYQWSLNACKKMSYGFGGRILSPYIVHDLASRIAYSVPFELLSKTVYNSMQSTRKGMIARKAKDAAAATSKAE